MTTQPRPIREIAREIERDWTNVNFGAKPYLKAMKSLLKVTDRYYLDSAETVIRYFLANAGTWRGPVARRIKIELKGMVNG